MPLIACLIGIICIAGSWLAGFATAARCYERKYHVPERID